MHKASSSPSLPSVVSSHSSHPRRQPLSHSVPALPDDMHRERSCPKPPWDVGDRKAKTFIQTTSTRTGQNTQGLLRAVQPPNTNFIFNITNSSHVLQQAELQVSSKVLIPSERSKVWTFQRRGVDTGDSNKVSDTFTQEKLTQCHVLHVTVRRFAWQEISGDGLLLFSGGCLNQLIF